MNLEFRPVSSADHETLYALHVSLFRDYIEQVWGWNEEKQIENFRKEMKDSGNLTIFHDGKFVGYLQRRDHHDHIYLMNLAITPENQGYGIGSEMIKRLQHECQLREIDLILSVFRANNRAIDFYRRHDFEITEITENGFRLRWKSLSTPLL